MHMIYYHDKQQLHVGLNKHGFIISLFDDTFYKTCWSIDENDNTDDAIMTMTLLQIRATLALSCFASGSQ